MTVSFDTSEFDGLIQKRIEPTIYAFKTDKVKDSIKVGDTIRPVLERVYEWERVYGDLKLIFTESAKVGEDMYFRDHAVHQFLKSKPHIINLRPEDFQNGVHPSKEFFKNASKKDLKDAIKDIKEDAANNTNFYSYYDSKRLKASNDFLRNQTLKLRGNQEEVVDRFKRAVKADRNNLLMYAVMRFGKTFTTLYCAQENKYKRILVLTGKAEALSGWKECVQKNTNFENFKYIDKTSLKTHPNIISKELGEGKTVVIGLTLQDVYGDKIKIEHEQVFSTNWDLLIIDETHFAADADQYGKIIKERSVLKNKTDGIQEQSPDKKILNVGVTLHVSGTPYRLLLDGKFDTEDIIAQVQYSDIIAAHDEWVEENKLNENLEEWDNPYFGFPRMLRFAFDLNEKSLAIIRELESQGYSSSLDEIFKPQSIVKDEKLNKHLKFCHEEAVLDFLKAIDGRKSDPNMLSFLDHKRIKEDNLCRHIVMVLPYKSSCDAMEKMLRSHHFNHLRNYEIINRAGHESPKIFSSSQKVANYIAKCDKEDKKTITLTVNKMLTGVTVPEWDTMFFLKDTQSPQEYDQAIFRLQNPFVKRYYNKKEKKEIQIVAKPQTFLLDFSPMRLFSLQERRSKIINWSKGEGSNQQLESALNRDLKNSPIIILSANKIRPVIANEIIDKIAAYEKSKSIRDEVRLIPVDKKLLESPDLINVIKNLNGINNKSGILQKTYTGEPGSNETDPDVTTSGDVTSISPANNLKEQKKKKTEEESLADKVQAYYSLILFYALLTHDTVRGVEDIISSVGSSERNIELSKNLGISKTGLSLFKKLSSPATLSILDTKILRVNQMLNSLSSDNETQFLDKIYLALKRFGRISDSEIVTPPHFVDEIVTALYENSNIRDGKFLDIASKQGEFAIGLIKKYGKTIKDNIYSIPTSSIAYEFTRRIYELYDMPVDNIFKDFNSYDLIKKDGKEYIKKLADMRFDAILGNPPYNDINKGNGNGANPLFHLFIDLGCYLSKTGLMIHPGRFLFNAGKTPKKWNEKILSNPHFKVVDYWVKSFDVFNNVDVKGGIAITMWNENEKYDPIGFFTPFPEVQSILDKIKTESFKSFADIVYPRDLYKLTETFYTENPWAEGRQSKGHRLDIGSNIFDVFPEIFIDNAPNDSEYIGIYGLEKKNRVTKWIKRDYVKLPDNIDKFKVFIPKSNGSGAIGEVDCTPIIGKPVVGKPGIGHSLTFLSIGNFSKLSYAEACFKYLKTRFARLLLGTIKVTQDNPKDTWANVPMQDFTRNVDIDWRKSVENIEKQLYKKYRLSDTEIAFIESMIKPM